jgi:hypothetical protein
MFMLWLIFVITEGAIRTQATTGTQDTRRRQKKKQTNKQKTEQNNNNK